MTPAEGLEVRTTCLGGIAAPWEAATIDIEMPGLGWGQVLLIHPYAAGGVTFTSRNPCAGAALGFMRKIAVTGCALGFPASQGLGTGSRIRRLLCRLSRKPASAVIARSLHGVMAHRPCDAKGIAFLRSC